MTNYEELLQIMAELSSESIDTLLAQAKSIKDAENATKDSQSRVKKPRSKEPCPKCPTCMSGNVVRDGKNHGNQRYWCKNCNRTFVSTTNTIMSKSRSTEAVWRNLIEDTFEGRSLDYSAEKYDLHHETVFNMRHKILLAIQQLGETEPITLQNIAELDETYVLESKKGKKFEDNAPRVPRKRGSKASKRGLSSEQVCICAGVERNKGSAYAVTVNCAGPSKEKITEAFTDHIEAGTVLFTDGLKGYGVLQDEIDCVVNGVSVDNMKKSKTANLNNVNSFHSFIKDRYRTYRGVASKYINRYNALFANGFRDRKKTINEICSIVLSPSTTDYHVSVSELQSKQLFDGAEG